MTIAGLVVALAGATLSAGTAAAARHHASGGTLTIADVAPFTGTDASLGPTYLVACDAAANAINHAGGILGHHVNCKSVDTRGDPADGVPAVRQMYASTSNLALVIGLTSDTAASTAPIINANKTVMFAMTGQSEFDHVHFPYFYRLVPPDVSEAYADMAIAKYYLHVKRVALAFGNDIGSQAFVKPAIKSAHKAGLKVVANETLDLSANTFRTEAQRIVAAKPQVIFTEALGPTDATFLSEVKQENHGKMIPVIGTSATISPSWFKSVSAALGASTLAKNYVGDNLVTLTSGPAYRTYARAMLAEKGKVGKTGDFSTYLSSPGAVHLYDGINLAALAMVKAKSVVGRDYHKDIKPIGDGSKGAVVVHTFAQGVKELKAGKKIRYIGPGGPTNFDSFHDSPGIFQIDKYSAKGKVLVVKNIPISQIRALS